MGEDRKRLSLIIKLKVSSSCSNNGGFKKEDSHLHGTKKTKLVSSSSVEEITTENYSSNAATDFTFLGIQPNNFISSHGILSDVVKSLPQWSKTAKRGRKGFSPSPTVSSYSYLTSDEKAQEPLLGEKEAVDALMHLWELSDKYCLDSAKKNQSKKRKVEDTNYVDDTRQALKKKKMNFEVFHNNKKRKPVLFSSETFRCDICEKSFSCYQALGGHKSSCKSSRLKSHVDKSLLQGSIRNTHNISKELTSPSTHQCKICNKTFLTGQVLGGHTKLHRDGPNEPKVVSTELSLYSISSLTSSVQGAKDDLACKKIVMFDLNEQPPDDEDESV